MLVRSLSRAIAQALDPAFRGVVLKSVLITLVVYGLLTAAYLALLPDIKVVEDGWWSWVNNVLEAGSAIFFFAVLILLFANVASLIGSLFLEEIADAVDRRYYPGGPPARKVSMAESFATSLRFTVIALLLNILALILYIPALFIAPLFFIIFYTLNGYLLSREYFELVSLRFLKQNQASKIRRANSGTIFVAGVAIAFGTTIPIFNLFVPILATALMEHVFRHVWDGKSTGGPSGS